MSVSPGATEVNTVIPSHQPTVKSTPHCSRQCCHSNDCDLYLCGPPTLMQSLYDQRRELRVGDERIYAQALGYRQLAGTGRSARACPEYSFRGGSCGTCRTGPSEG